MLKNYFLFRKLSEVLKANGGEGSGNHGHAGRPGKVGGSAGRFEGIKTVHGIASYWLTPEDELINVRGDYKGHAHAVVSNPERFGLTDEQVRGVVDSTGFPKNAGVQAEIILKATTKGFIRVAYNVSSAELSLNVGKIDTNTLRRLQALDNDGAFPFPIKKVILDDGFEFDMVSYADFISASSIVELRRVNSNSKDVIKNGGSGSGNFDHAGRPGEVGGSAAAGVKHLVNAPGWVDGIDAGYQKIPEKVKAKTGASVITVETIEDYDAALGKVGVFQRAGGMYNSQKNEIVIPWKKKDALGESVLNSIGRDVIAHEYGHAFDYTILGSQSVEFIDAYTEERDAFLSWISSNPSVHMSKQSVSYFFGKPDKYSLPAQEFYAETFCYIVIGKSNVFGLSALMQDHFPKTIAVVKRHVEEE